MEPLENSSIEPAYVEGDDQTSKTSPCGSATSPKMPLPKRLARSSTSVRRGFGQTSPFGSGSAYSAIDAPPRERYNFPFLSASDRGVRMQQTGGAWNGRTGRKLIKLPVPVVKEFLRKEIVLRIDCEQSEARVTLRPYRIERRRGRPGRLCVKNLNVRGSRLWFPAECVQQVGRQRSIGGYRAPDVPSEWGAFAKGIAALQPARSTRAKASRRINCYSDGRSHKLVTAASTALLYVEPLPTA